MKWNDLKQLEVLLLKTEQYGAIIKEIGKSGQQQPIYSVSVGDKNPDRAARSGADRTIVAIAGMHASEVIGKLALVDLIDKLNSDFNIPTTDELNSRDDRDRCGTSIEFVTKKFQPSFIGVSEIPLGICRGLHNAPIEKIESFNKQLAQNIKVDLPYQELDLSTQIELIHEFVLASGKYLLKQD